MHYRTSVPHFLVCVVAALWLVGAAGPVLAQEQCIRDDDQLRCEDGWTYPIRDDPFGFRPAFRDRQARGGVEAGPTGETLAPMSPPAWTLGEDAPAAGSYEDRYLYGPDGLVCVRHLDHVHCNR